MTAHKDDTPETPMLRDSERTEFEWLMARDADPSEPAPSTKIAEDYTQLEGLLATLPDDRDDGWQADLLAKVRAEAANGSQRDTDDRTTTPIRRRRVGRWIGVSGGLVAAAVLAVIVFPRAPTPDTPVALTDLTIFQDSVAVRGARNAIHVGTTIETDAVSASAELRLYDPTDALIARCPDGPGCLIAGGQQRIKSEVRKQGRYHLLRTEQHRVGLPESRKAYVETAKAQRIQVFSQVFTAE